MNLYDLPSSPPHLIELSLICLLYVLPGNLQAKPRLLLPASPMKCEQLLT